MHNNVYYFLFEFLATKPKDLNKDGEHPEADRNNEWENTDDDGI